MADAALKATHFYILLALSREDRHGLAIARDVQTLSDGRVRLWPATLYGSLEELCDRRWIEELDEHPEDESERRRYYRLTGAGRQALAAEAEHMSRVARLARSRVRPRTGEAR
jgi:DNA-binding PadR family transcriptional regulator